MIVPMKKIHVIVQNKNIVSALENLRDLGVLHVEHQEELSGYQLEERREEVSVLQQALNIFERMGRNPNVPQKEVPDWTDTVYEVLKLWAEIEHYQETIVQRVIQIQQWRLWGNFDPKGIQDLAARDIYIQLCEMPAKKTIEFPTGVIVEKIFTASNVARLLAIAREKITLPVQAIVPPSLSLREMENLQAQDQAKVRQAQASLARLRCYENSFKKILIERENVLHFEEVQKGMREDEALAVLKGFCPADVCVEIEQKARKEHWGILLEEPSAEDRVPTLMRNPRWVNAIKPIFSFINIIPDYRELDISPVFLIFFSLFVGMLIGDAGYGALTISVFMVFHFLLRKKNFNPMFFYLAYLLSGCTILWGALTGVYFGQKWIGQTIPPLVPWLSSIENVQMLCFLIGAIHLSLAHAWRAVQKWPSLTFLVDVGWFMIVWAMYFAANYFVLGSPFPVIASAFIVLGVLFLVVFPKPNFDPLLPLSIISCFTDVVSYIRLFAVGLATVAVADAANDMGIFWIIVLHSLNIALAALAILVHALRLNILEFSVHLNMTWAGVPYDPFQKINHH